jgi:hypothetical protein
MIKKRYILIPLLGLAIGVLVIGAIVAYILFLNKPNEDEVVFKATEFGTPLGDKVTKEIGPAGGTLSSPDGRLALTVPEAALSETVAFSIQPVTNKFDGGLGISYRLGPAETTFINPLEISFNYDDHDLEGTFPEALAIAYQDKDGAWTMRRAVELDKDKKTIKVSTTHFSTDDLAFRVKLVPDKATVRVGESVKILATDCNAVSPIWGLIGMRCIDGWGYGSTWTLQGEGKIKGDYPYMIYTAPGKKPTPNVATVVLYEPDFMVSVERPCTKSDIHIVLGGKNMSKIHVHKCYDRVPSPESLKSVITIVDRGYQATGNDGPTTYDGIVCDVTKPFTVIGRNGRVTFTNKFTPSSGTAGTGETTANYGGALLNGGGGYTITEKPSGELLIVYDVASKLHVGSRTGGGSGAAHIDLIPLDSDQCGK